MSENQNAKYIQLIKDYVYKNYKLMLREPAGLLKHKFIVPGSAYANQLWDWDSWSTDIAIRQILCDLGEENDLAEYEKGCVINFLDHTDKTGYMPIAIRPNEVSIFGITGFDANMHKPCLVQHIAFIIRNINDVEWIRSHYAKVELFVNAYIKHYRHKCGLYFWADDFAIGVDNDPCTYYRPNNSSASVYLNTLMYKELEAMEFLSGKLGYNDKAEIYKTEKETLKRNIMDKLWDEKDGFYYSADLNLKPIDLHNPLHAGAPRNWDYLIQRIGVWSGILPMWAGIATQGQAERIVRENYLDTRTFNSPYGMRSLSKMEKMYQPVVSSNPSCWLGPIWGIVNYFMFRALIKYNFIGEARELAYKTIGLFGKDIEKNGAMHEYYNPENGDGIHNKGFQSWNLLVINMIAYLEGRKTISEF